MVEKVQVVAAIIERNGRVLFGKRSPQRLAAPGYFCPVSGRIEAGESQARAVEREALEEVGLSVRALEKVGECDTHDGSARIHWWRAAPLDDAPAQLLGDEHTELCWVTLEEMRRLEPVFAEDVEIIARAADWRPPSPEPARRISEVAQAYDAWANSYDIDPNKTRELAAAVLRQAALPLDGAQVLELGCGTGENTVWLAERAADVLALDISDGMLQKARALVTAPSVQFAQHDIDSVWPLGAASADIVIAMLVLEHIRDLAAIFTEASRVLRGGGRLFLIELHPTRQMLGKRARYTNPQTAEPAHVPAYPHDVADYVNGALRAGFSVLGLGEWRDAGASFADPPRVLSAAFVSRST